MELARRLLAAGLVSPAELGKALLLAEQEALPFALALVQAGVLTEAELEGELASGVGLPLRAVQPSFPLCARLPPHAARRLGVVPVRRDPVTGVVDAVALSPLDSHPMRELSFLLGAPVRLLRGRFADVEEALRRAEAASLAPNARRPRSHTPAFPHGAPLSWRPGPKAEAPAPVDAPFPLVRRSVQPPPPVAGRDAPDAIAVPLRSTKRYPEVGTATFVGAAAASDKPPARTGPTGKTLVPPGPLAAPAPTSEGAPRLREPVRGDESPETRNGPAFGGRAPSVEVRAPAPDELAELVAAVLRAPSRDAVVERVLRGLERVARRAAIVAVRRETYVGWVCNGAFGDPAAFRALTVSHAAPSIFRTAGTTIMYLGPVPLTPAHESLLQVMGHASNDVAAVSVRVAGRPVMVLLADELDDTLLGTRRMDELARAAGEALTHLLSHR